MSPAELRKLPPTLDLVTAGKILGISRGTAYSLAQRGKFPVKVLKLGNQYRVVTADLLRVLSVGDGSAA